MTATDTNIAGLDIIYRPDGGIVLRHAITEDGRNGCEVEPCEGFEVPADANPPACPTCFDTVLKDNFASQLRLGRILNAFSEFTGELPAKMAAIANEDNQ